MCGAKCRLTPGVFCAKRASLITASLGWTAVVDTGVGAEEVSSSRGTGEPSRERLSGVWTPLECAESTPEWLGDAGALLRVRRSCWNEKNHTRPLKCTIKFVTGGRSQTWKRGVHVGSWSRGRPAAFVSWRPARWAWPPRTGLSSRMNLCRAPPATVPLW